MICNICGAENNSNIRFCIKCGNSLEYQNRLNNSDEKLNIPQAGPPPIQNTYENQQPIHTNPYMNQQPMMYGQPQFMGYDASGMPIYAPPVYNQPQFMGYDASGMPIYAQPVCSQPQFMGYDASGMPVYSQPLKQEQNMQSMPVMSETEEKTVENSNQKSDADDFWAFFDEEKSSEHREKQSSGDFFGKSSHGGVMNDVSTAGLNLDSLRRDQKKKNSYMNDTPLVDADKLEKHDSGRFSKYMPQTAAVNADDLKANTAKKTQDKMGITKAVDVSRLSSNMRIKSRISMDYAGNANPDTLEAYVPEHKEAIMAQADHAVEAMPKKINPYESELDKIELPEYMQARKTVHEEVIEIPSIPQLGKNKN